MRRSTSTAPRARLKTLSATPERQRAAGQRYRDRLKSEVIARYGDFCARFINLRDAAKLRRDGWPDLEDYAPRS